MQKTSYLNRKTVTELLASYTQRDY